MHFTEPELDLLTGLVSTHILVLARHLRERTDLTPAGVDQYRSQLQLARQAWERLQAAHLEVAA